MTLFPGSLASVGGISLVLTMAFSELGCSRGATHYIEKGNRFFAEGKYPEAALSYRNAIKIDPKSGDAHHRFGLAEAKQSNWRSAYTEFRRAVELAPGREEYWVDFADLVLNFYSNDRTKPKVLYDQLGASAEFLLRKDPNSFQGLRFRGDLLSLDGKLDEAIAVFQKAEAIRPMQPQVTLPMVQVLFRLNRTVEAEALARKFVDRHKDFGPGYDLLIGHYIQSKRMPEAEAVLKSKVASLPKDANAWLQLAALYLQIPNERAMDQALQGILSNPKEFPQGHQLVGDFYTSNGKFDEALHQYATGVQAHSEDSVLYRKRMVKALIAKGKPGEALQELDLVLKSQPDDLDARLARAILLRDSDNPKQLAVAETEFNAILQKSPNDEVARYNLGLVYMKKGDLQAARGQLQKSAGLRPDYIPPRLTLAEIAQQTHDYSETIRVADEVLAIDPENADAKLWRGAGMIGNKTFQAARTELNGLLREHPDSMNVNLHMAVLDASEKKYREAESRYLKLYKPGQKDLRPLEGLIQIYAEQRQAEKSLKLLRDELKQAADSRRIHRLLAAAAAQGGKLDLAIQQYQWLQANDPGSVDAYVSLGEVYRAKGDIQSALASYQRAGEIAPNNPNVMAMVAYLETAAGQQKEAIASLERQLSVSPDDTTAMNNLAFILADSGGNLDAALTLAAKAQRKAPHNAGIADTLGWVYTKKGLNDSAIQIFTGLVSKYPEDPAFLYHLGVALLQRGNNAQAKAELTRSLSKKPSKEIADKVKEILARIG